jgi:hypothetical protein
MGLTMAYFKASLNPDTNASGAAGGVRPPDKNTKDPRVIGGKDTLPLCRLFPAAGVARDGTSCL